MSLDLKRLQKKIGFEFIERSLLERALTHRSIGAHNNERLEFLGDSILGFVIADEIYHKFPKADEGMMSRLRASLVNGATLATIAIDLNLGEELVLGQGERKSGGRHRQSILSDALEAIIGAIYLDVGIEKTRVWVLAVFEERLNKLTDKEASKDPKTQLQEYLQAKGLSVPVYDVLSTTGADHEQLFTVECKVGILNDAIVAKANSRKKAEQKAAEKVMQVLNG